MLAIRQNSENYDIQTEAQIQNENDDEETADDIPYHVRKNAKPFTYGSVPIGFTKSELNHVDVDKPRELPRKPPVPPPSPLMLRKRPSISPSRPVVHKTPTREEFEEMLIEKREQSLRDRENALKKQIQCAAVEKDLSELQQKLNRRLALEDSHAKLAITAKNHDNDNDDNDHDDDDEVDNAISRHAMSIFEENDRVSPIRKAETPSFPEIMDDRCISPYPMLPPVKSNSNALLPRATSQSNEELREMHSTPAILPNEFYEVAPHLVSYAKDTSEFWYKPNMTRQEAVSLLRNAEPGTFLIRNSTTYQNAYGLVLRVARPPPGVLLKQGSNNEELVRHFLLEPSTRGVRLKGYANEPLFTSLSAFVYEHSTNPLALPCKLVIPQQDILYSSRDAELIAAQKTLSTQGAACNVLYLFSHNTESLTGDEAIRRTVYEMFARRSVSKPVEVHFKVTQQGITLTDNTRTQFFRRFYTANHISYCALDPDKRFWSVTFRDGDLERVSNKTIFAFVARPLTGCRDNECHLFCDLADSQPASAIVSFINKVIPINRRDDAML